MNWVDIVSLLCGSGVVSLVLRHILRRIKANDRKTEAVCYGVQALLRDRLIDTYNKYTDKGYAPIYIKENFENMWKQYHNLGVNGVMDGLHEKFMKLPDRRSGENES
jgi:putative intracellular protease/amidase